MGELKIEISKMKINIKNGNLLMGWFEFETITWIKKNFGVLVVGGVGGVGALFMVWYVGGVGALCVVWDVGESVLDLSI